jgi:hypothetical protein
MQRSSPSTARGSHAQALRLQQGEEKSLRGTTEKAGIPYQSLINLYLKDCAATGKRLNLAWKAPLTKSAA